MYTMRLRKLAPADRLKTTRDRNRTSFALSEAAAAGTAGAESAVAEAASDAKSAVAEAAGFAVFFFPPEILALVNKSTNSSIL